MLFSLSKITFLIPPGFASSSLSQLYWQPPSLISPNLQANSKKMWLLVASNGHLGQQHTRSNHVLCSQSGFSTVKMNTSCDSRNDTGQSCEEFSRASYPAAPVWAIKARVVVELVLLGCGQSSATKAKTKLFPASSPKPRTSLLARCGKAFRLICPCRITD